ARGGGGGAGGGWGGGEGGGASPPGLAGPAPRVGHGVLPQAHETGLPPQRRKEIHAEGVDQRVRIADAPVRAQQGHLPPQDGVRLFRVEGGPPESKFDVLAHGFHSRNTSGDWPPWTSALRPTRPSSGAGIERPVTSASPVDRAGSSSMSCLLSRSDAFTMKCWSSGFFRRMTISVLHWLVTSGSSLLGRWLTMAKPTPNLRPSAAIRLMMFFEIDASSPGAKLWPSSNTMNTGRVGRCLSAAAFMISLEMSATITWRAVVESTCSSTMH